MGVIHKFGPEIIEFILANKKSDSNLSCRRIVDLITGKFQVEVSKSRVNSVIQNAGLSLPVGRRRTKRKYTIKEKSAQEIPLLPPQEPPKQLTAEVIQKEEKPIEEPAQEIKEIQEAQPIEKAEEAPQKPVPEIKIPEEKPEEKPKEAIAEEPVETPTITVEETLPVETETTGAVLLKAADALIGGSLAIGSSLGKRLSINEKDILGLTEGLLYLPLFEQNNLHKMWPLVGKILNMQRLSGFLNSAQELKTVSGDILMALSGILQETRFIEVSLSDATTFYIDAEMHTVWSTPYIPFDFCGMLHETKNNLKRYLEQELPFVLFMAPGYDAPLAEFFSFLTALENQGKRIAKISLCGNKFEKLESLSQRKIEAHSLVFGMWPWQFTAYRKVKNIAEFKPYRHPFLNEELYLAEIEIELTQASINKTLTFKGAALKRDPAQKIKFLMLSNAACPLTPEEIANLYLARWPNIEEAFQDYSQKIEFFTYAASDSQALDSWQNFQPEQTRPQELNVILGQYLKYLDSYVRRHFLPRGFEDKTLSDTKEQFYSLICTLKKQDNLVSANLRPSPRHPLLKELAYACRRINEREALINGKKLIFQIIQ